jgi:hypothetical protein
MPKKVAKVSKAKVAGKKVVSENRLPGWVVGVSIAAVLLGGTYVIAKYYGAQQAQVMQVGTSDVVAYNDNFSDLKINDTRWTIYKSDATAKAEDIQETTADNLRISLQKGPDSDGTNKGKAKSAALVFKQPFPAGKDFRIGARIYPPTVVNDTGVKTGVGIAGVRFIDNSANDTEGTTIAWRKGLLNGVEVNELVFTVTNGTGTGSTTSKVVKLTGGKEAQVMIRRVGTEYIGMYRMDNFDDDNPWITISKVTSTQIGSSGTARLYVSNVGNAGVFPAVSERFDAVSMSSNTGVTVFSDNFKKGGVPDATKWGISNNQGVSAPATEVNDNLKLSVLATLLKTNSAKSNPGNVHMAAKTEVGADKSAYADAELFKPQLGIGDGAGVSGVYFASSAKNSVDAESATVRWQVTKSTLSTGKPAVISELYFKVLDTQGKLVGTEHKITLSNKVTRLTLRLSRNSDSYTAHYRVGPGLDDDSGWASLGSETGNLGAKGHFGVFATQRGSVLSNGNETAPAVNASFDSFILSYNK